MIIFTSHSLLKLKQRKISKAKVIETLKNPDYVAEGYANRKIALKRFDKLYLKVIYKKENKDIVIITQYFTSKF